MSKRITEITIERTAEYTITYTPADKDYRLDLAHLGFMGYFKTADEARAMVASYRETGTLEQVAA